MLRNDGNDRNQNRRETLGVSKIVPVEHVSTSEKMVNRIHCKDCDLLLNGLGLSNTLRIYGMTRLRHPLQILFLPLCFPKDISYRR